MKEPEITIEVPAAISEALVERLRRRINQETARLTREALERRPKRVRRNKRKL